MKNQLQLVTYEQATMLKKLGFDIETYKYYCDKYPIHGITLNDAYHFGNWNESDKNFSAPTVALALKWFRDEKDIEYSIEYGANYFWHIHNISHENTCDVGLETYDEAESALLDELLTILEKQQ
jgi:hypothetical protein